MYAGHGKTGGGKGRAVEWRDDVSLRGRHLASSIWWRRCSTPRGRTEAGRCAVRRGYGEGAVLPHGVIGREVRLMRRFGRSAEAAGSSELVRPARHRAAILCLKAHARLWSSLDRRVDVSSSAAYISTAPLLSWLSLLQLLRHTVHVGRACQSTLRAFPC
jgi:hypothetical protein